MKKLVEIITDVVGTFALRPSPTEIHNESDVPIFLIPISYFRHATPTPGKTKEELALSTGKISEKLAKEIEKDGVASVDWWRYSPSFKGYPSKTKIIFYAGTAGDKLTNILQNLDRSRDLLKGAKVYDHTILCQKPRMYLKLEGGKVKVEPQDETKTREELAKHPPESPDNKPRGESLSNLTKEVEALKFHMATLGELLEKLQVELKSVSEASSSKKKK